MDQLHLAEQSADWSGRSERLAAAGCPWPLEACCNPFDCPVVAEASHNLLTCFLGPFFPR